MKRRLSGLRVRIKDAPYAVEMDKQPDDRGMMVSLQIVPSCACVCGFACVRVCVCVCVRVCMRMCVKKYGPFPRK